MDSVASALLPRGGGLWGARPGSATSARQWAVALKIKQADARFAHATMQVAAVERAMAGARQEASLSNLGQRCDAAKATRCRRQRVLMPQRAVVRATVD